MPLETKSCSQLVREGGLSERDIEGEARWREGRYWGTEYYIKETVNSMKLRKVPFWHTDGLLSGPVWLDGQECGKG